MTAEEYSDLVRAEHEERLRVLRENLAKAQAKVYAVVGDDRLGNWGLSAVEIKKVNRLRSARNKALIALEQEEAWS